MDDLVYDTQEIRANFERIVRSTSVMGSDDGTTQSGIWVSPRIFISALHFRKWMYNTPTQAECQLVIDGGMSFTVENEISSKLLTDHHSPRIRLIGFQPDDDVGIFKLQDGYADREDWVPVESLVEPDEAVQYGLTEGTSVACVGFCGSVSDAQAYLIRDTARQHLLQQIGNSAAQVSTI